jgi:hypothetical protein
MSIPRVEALLARLEKGKLKTLDILGRLGPEQWQQVVYPEPYPWTARDLLAHFVSSEPALLRMCQDVASGGTGTPEGFDFDAFNAEEQKRLAGQAPQDLLESLAYVRQETLEWLRSLDDDRLDLIGRHPALGEVSLETMILAIYGHQLLHMRDLQSALI